jgi:hypothetical protein
MLSSLDLGIYSMQVAEQLPIARADMGFQIYTQDDEESLERVLSSASTVPEERNREPDVTEVAMGILSQYFLLFYLPEYDVPGEI